jgi:hypothetical protein
MIDEERDILRIDLSGWRKLLIVFPAGVDRIRGGGD